MQFCKPSQAVENNTGFVSLPPPPPDVTGKREGKMTQEVKAFFHHSPFTFQTAKNTHCQI
jgi:hypothetical protein